MSQILLGEVPCASGGIGVATLNAEPSLNSLTMEMIKGLSEKLREWETREDIAIVIIQGAGEKAFCAGGDIKLLYQSINARDRGAEEFFENEYKLDHQIHVYPKPIIIWGHGIVMGGGLGIMAGGGYRLVTESSRLAMPEITIGLYPDVGASFFLHRMPGLTGKFLGLTGARMNAADALFAKLGTHFIQRSLKDELLATLKLVKWKGLTLSQIKEKLDELTHEFSERSKGALPESDLKNNFEQINAVMNFDNLGEIACALSREDLSPWIKNAARTFQKGSPTSAHVIFELLKRTKNQTLKQCFETEFALLVQFARHHDLREGIRALLIDRDNQPHWEPAEFGKVSRALIDEHFVSPWPNGFKKLF